VPPRQTARPVIVALITLALVPAARARADSFVHWETPHVHPMDMTPDGALLLVVNTPDNRLEMINLGPGGAAAIDSVFTGLDPVSVRARTADEAWVVNHVSDTISIIELQTRRVIETLHVGDEPSDVVFAGSPLRAFVCISQQNEVWVFDPADLAAPPVILPIAGEDPRALATDGQRVFAAVFESGNGSTILSEFEVSGGGPYAGVNPPPNDGAAFNPPIAEDLPPPPTVGMIVKKNAAGVWQDDNDGDWSSLVTWDLHDHDVAIIEADTLAVTYATGLMNLNMALAVRPDGRVTVVGTDGTNHVRFEPNLRGTFIRALAATFDPTDPDDMAIHDLNPHLDYATHTVPIATREQSIGDPRGIAWNAAGTRGYVAGMGSNNLVAIDHNAERIGRIDVGRGPTGVAIDDARQRVYVLNKFDGSISIIDAASLTEIQRVTLFDPTPAVIRTGRPHLYDTHKNSGLGQAACASCHPDARMDQLAWDLGDPAGDVQPIDQPCQQSPVFGPCDDWHPMKGPLVTQTLIGSGSSPPLHWRGDRADLSAFNPTFVDLHGADAQLTAAEMDEFAAFLDTIHFPPNPFRNLDGSPRATPLDNGGIPANGATIFNGCTGCHRPESGFNSAVVTSAFRGDSQSFNTSHLRNMYEKTGFERSRQDNNRGFGFLHDGHTDTLFNLLAHPVFAQAGGNPIFPPGETGDQLKRDVEAFLLSDAVPLAPHTTHAAVGRQTVLITGPPNNSAQITAVQQFVQLVNNQSPAGRIALVAHGHVAGAPRGFAYVGGGQFQSDRADEAYITSQMFGLGGPGNRLVFTIVPFGSATRIGIDRDEDGALDGDERDACSDPADPSVVPGNVSGGNGDVNGDGWTNGADVAAFIDVLLAAPPTPPDAPFCAADFNADGAVDAADAALLAGRLLNP